MYSCAGPGFQADFYLGNCSLSGDPIPIFDCQGPSATFTSTPATFTAKYKSAVEFVGEVRVMGPSSRSAHTHQHSHYARLNVYCSACNAAQSSMLTSRSRCWLLVPLDAACSDSGLCTCQYSAFVFSPCTMTRCVRAQQCALTHSFGDTTSQILFVFDPASSPLLNNGPLASIISNALNNVSPWTNMVVTTCSPDNDCVDQT